VAWLALVAAARRADVAILAVLASLLIVSPALRGHAADGPLGPAVVVHVAAVGAWIGGLVALLATARVVTRLAARDRQGLFASVVEHFGTVALPCAVAVLVTGTLQAIGSLDGPAQLATTGYGLPVALKLALFAGLIALAARSRRWLVARLRSPDGARAAAALRTTIVTELALAGLALAAAGVLAGTAPPC
jgi:copper transport protein